MQWQMTPYALIIVTSMVLSGALAIYGWRYRSTPGALPFSAAMLALTLWSFGYTIEKISALFWLQKLSAYVQVIGYASVPFLWLIFALQYTNRDAWLTPRRIALLMTEPVLVTLCAWTNEFHHWFFDDFQTVHIGTTVQLDVSFASAFWIHTILAYIVLAAGTVLLLQGALRSRELYRSQVALLLVGAIIPWIGNALSIFGLLPLPNLDLTTAAFALSGLAIAGSLFRYRLFDIVPVAYEAIVRSMDDMVIVLDTQNRVADLNPAAEAFFVGPNGAVIGKPAEQALDRWGEIAEKYREAVAAHIEIGLGEGNDRRWFDLHASHLQRRDEQPAGMLIVLHDVTASKLAQQALQEAHDQIATLHRVETELNKKLNLRYVLMMAQDAAIRVSKADAAFIGLTDGEGGMRIAQAYGSYPEEVIDIRLSPDSGITGRVIRRRQAELIPDVSIDPDYDAYIPETHAQITLPLITQEQLVGVLNLETANPEYFTPSILEILKLLAARIAAAVDNARMYEERERLVKDLDAYAHSVAHDLKNPIGVILGAVEVIGMRFSSSLPEAAQKLYNIISRNSRKMIDIINALLLIASVREGKEVVMDHPDMAAIVNEVLNRLSNDITASQAHISVPDRWPGIRGYAPWIEEVWVNYISNAIKYGGTPPQIELGATEQGDGKVRFWVRDNGTGLSQEDQSMLFTQFTRLDQSKAEGHGLGLSIVQRIVERLGGQVGVESAVGQGSTFFFTLPSDVPLVD